MAARAVEFFIVQGILEGNDADEEQRQQNINMQINRRYMRDHFNPFEVSNNTFFSLYRLNKVAARMLIEDLRPHMPVAIRSTAVPQWMKVLTALDFFAAGSYQRRVGQDCFHAMSQAMVSIAIGEVVSAMDHLMVAWIKFPTSAEEIRETKQKFMQAHNFPGIIGAVDGTHIAIVPPEKAREHLFANRKTYHSKNVQIVCDSELRILAINARFGGRSHDAHVWRMSDIRRRLKQRYLTGMRGAWLLGDSGYPSEPWLLRPFENHPDPDSPEGRFNTSHCSCRSLVERCIGLLKAKFRCCRHDRTLHYSPEMAGLIINACAVVHNIGIHYRVPIVHPEYDDIDLPHNAVVVVDVPGAQPAGPGDDIDFHAIGQATRRRVVHDHFR